jgi:hypothetical protein
MRGGDAGGWSGAMLRVLVHMGGTAFLVGSFCFLDVLACSAETTSNAGLLIGLASNSRGGGNVDGEWECEPCGDDCFPYLLAILWFSL